MNQSIIITNTQISKRLFHFDFFSRLTAQKQVKGTSKDMTL